MAAFPQVRGVSLVRGEPGWSLWETRGEPPPATPPKPNNPPSARRRPRPEPVEGGHLKHQQTARRKTPLNLQRVHHRQERKPSKVPIPRSDPPNPVLPHQNRRMQVRNQVAPRLRHVLQRLRHHLGMARRGNQQLQRRRIQQRPRESAVVRPRPHQPRNPPHPLRPDPQCSSPPNNALKRQRAGRSPPLHFVHLGAMPLDTTPQLVNGWSQSPIGATVTDCSGSDWPRHSARSGWNRTRQRCNRDSACREPRLRETEAPHGRSVQALAAPRETTSRPPSRAVRAALAEGWTALGCGTASPEYVPSRRDVLSPRVRSTCGGRSGSNVASPRRLLHSGSAAVSDS